jgi:hypothetical protein
MSLDYPPYASLKPSLTATIMASPLRSIGPT